MNFGEELKKLRKEKKLSIRKLGELSNISHAYISQLENSKRDTPKPDTLNKLAKGLNVPYLELLEKAGIYDNEDINIMKNTDNLLKNTKWELSTPDKNHEMMQQQNENALELTELLKVTNGKFVKYNGRLLTNKDKQRLSAAIELLFND
jgi:HTH-type transcriptional regulator, competence development regulator